MTRILLTSLLLVNFLFTAHGQRYIKYIPSDSTYVIPYEKASIINMWAKRGIQCEKDIVQTNREIEALKSYHRKSDSLSMVVKLDFRKCQEQVQFFDTRYQESQRLLAASNKTISQLKQDLKDEERQNRNMMLAIGGVTFSLLTLVFIVK